MHKTYIVAVNAISGGGKTTVTQYLKENLGNVEALYFDDRDYDRDSGIVDICKWMDEGADANRFNLDLLIEDIEQLLKKGLDFIILDYPFGRRHNKIAKYIDISMFIDTPLDIALARRLLRDYKCVSEKNVFDDIEFYLSRGRQTYLSSRERAIDDADVIIDGSEALNVTIDFIKSKVYELIKEQQIPI
jgi:uridine kinase